jgi:O-antigen/teichoic acid export membrane protein
MKIGLSQVVQVLVSFVKSKYLAVVGGSILLGRLSLFNAGVNTLLSTIFLGFYSYSLKTLMTIPNSEKKSYIDKLFGFVLVLILVSVLFLFVLPASLFTDKSNIHWKLKFSAMIVIISGQLSLFMANVIQSEGQYGRLAKTSSFSTVSALCFFVIGYYTLNDIYWSIALSSLTGLIVYVSFSWSFMSTLKFTLTWNSFFLVLRNTYSQGVIIGLSGFLDLGVLYFLKLYIVKNDSISTLGYFDSILILFNSIIGIFFSTVFTYFYPELMRFNSKDLAYNKIFRTYAKLSLFILAFFILVLFVGSEFLLKFVFTNDFLKYSSVFKLLILIIPMKFANWYINISVLIKMKPKEVIYYTLFIAVISLGIYILAFEWYHLNGIVLGMLLVNFLSVCSSLYVLRNESITYPVNLIISFLLLNIIALVLYYIYI